MVTIQAAAKCLKAKWSRDLATRHESRAHGFPGHRRSATRRVVGQPKAGEPCGAADFRHSSAARVRASRPTAAGAMGSSPSEGFSCALKSLRVIQVFVKDAEFGKKSRQPVKPICRKRESQIRVPEKRSAFPRHAQPNAFHRRDVRLQSRWFTRWHQSLRRSPTPTALL
jgi:hypothetical protein